jgi:REP element-mobilizing transposase RayT
MERYRKRVRHFHEPGHLHEFTFSCYHRWPLLTNNDWRRRLSGAIDGANSIWRCERVAFVFMPEHIHLLANPLEPDPGHESFRFWQKGPLLRSKSLDSESDHGGDRFHS